MPTATKSRAPVGNVPRRAVVPGSAAITFLGFEDAPSALPEAIEVSMPIPILDRSDRD
jgi:hypothetical protein